METNMMNECDNDCKESWDLALSILVATCADQDVVKDAAMVCSKIRNE